METPVVTEIKKEDVDEDADSTLKRESSEIWESLPCDVILKEEPQNMVEGSSSGETHECYKQTEQLGMPTNCIEGSTVYSEGATSYSNTLADYPFFETLDPLFTGFDTSYKKSTDATLGSMPPSQKPKERCYSCNKFFICIEKHHCPYAEESVKCSQCDETFKSTIFLKHHVLTKHSREPYKCTECSRVFKAKNDFIKHMYMHFKKKHHVCTYCLKSFYRSIELKKHLVSHNEGIHSKCPHCPKSTFVDEAEMMQHNALHNDYKCVSCNKTFVSVNQKIKHLTNCLFKNPHQR